MDAGAAARIALDRLEIGNVVARISQLADMGDLDDYVAQFTDDASWEMPGAPRHGRADIRAGAEQRRAEGLTGPGTNTRHVVSTIAVEVSGDAAVAGSYWQFYVDTTTQPRLHSMGHYRDTFLRAAGQWRLSRRQISVG